MHGILCICIFFPPLHSKSEIMKSLCRSKHAAALIVPQGVVITDTVTVGVAVVNATVLLTALKGRGWLFKWRSVCWCVQAGVSHSGGSFGVNSALLELDKEADDRYTCPLAVVTAHHNNLQSCLYKSHLATETPVVDPSM